VKGQEEKDSSFFSKVISIISCIGADPNDSVSIRLQKTTLLLSSLMMATLAAIWGSIYLAYGEKIAASIPYTYASLSFFSIAIFARTCRYVFFRTNQLLIPLLLPFLLQIALWASLQTPAL